jgi:hypothetical protein
MSWKLSTKLAYIHFHFTSSYWQKCRYLLKMLSSRNWHCVVGRILLMFCRKVRPPPYTLKMKAVCFSEMPVNFYQTIWCHKPEDSILKLLLWEPQISLHFTYFVTMKSIIMVNRNWYKLFSNLTVFTKKWRNLDPYTLPENNKYAWNVTVHRNHSICFVQLICKKTKWVVHTRGHIEFRQVRQQP